jgi:rSAM/selenodomain-associated transferase 2
MLSVCIPALNAAATLPATIASLGEADEIVVADGGSSDGTASLPGATIIQAPRGRGTQLHAAAQAAKGDWLLFLHADTSLATGWRAAAQAHIAAHPGKAAAYRFRLADPAWQARVIERGVAVRARALALPYGDQGLLISRVLYEQLGGYRPLPLMEDVDLVRRIGRNRLRLLPHNAVTSAERWRREGWFTRSARNAHLLLLYRLGASPERLARLYA